MALAGLSVESLNIWGLLKIQETQLRLLGNQPGDRLHRVIMPLPEERGHVAAIGEHLAILDCDDWVWLVLTSQGWFSKLRR